MKIGIAGCGITGTAVAAMLAEFGHEITIFEQAPECHPIGAGILLQPSGQQILKRLGLFEEIEAYSARLDGLDARLKSGRQLVRLKYARLDPEYYGLGVHRGLLFDRLLTLCKNRNVTIRTNSPVTGLEQNAKDAQFQIRESELSEPYDFVIAADGSRSRLREASGIRFHGYEYDYAALWMTGPLESIQDRLYQVVDGTQRLVGLLPIGEGQASFFWGLPANEYQNLIAGSFNQWKDEVISLCPEAEEILQNIESFESLIFTTYRHFRMDRWHTDRCIFLGDAAHPSSPHLGQGVNLALEDAACFTDALEQSTHFEAACQLYTSQRKAKLRYYQKVTSFLAPFFQSGYSSLAFGRNCVLPMLPSVPIVSRMMLQTLCGIKCSWLR